MPVQILRRNQFLEPANVEPLDAPPQPPSSGAKSGRSCIAPLPFSNAMVWRPIDWMSCGSPEIVSTVSPFRSRSIETAGAGGLRGGDEHGWGPGSVQAYGVLTRGGSTLAKGSAL